MTKDTVTVTFYYTQMTVEDYLKMIPEDQQRERALANMYKERANDNAKSMEHAIYWAFQWFKSPEGFDYWADYHRLVKERHTPIGWGINDCFYNPQFPTWSGVITSIADGFVKLLYLPDVTNTMSVHQMNLAIKEKWLVILDK